MKGYTNGIILYCLLGLIARETVAFLVPQPRQSNGFLLAATKEESDTSFDITSVSQLEKYFDEESDLFRNQKTGKIDYASRLKAANVQGDTQIIGDPNLPNATHPVVQLLHARRKEGFSNQDNFKVALSIEGGGMRGCLSAGMVAAVNYLGLSDAVDVVYGSSAGTVIGSYFVTRQLQWFGPEIYYDSLTTAGKTFIDSKRLLRALGLGLVNPKLWADFIKRPRFGKPVLNLNFLLKTTMQEMKPLDWERFVAQQSKQPLKIVASNLKAQEAIVMDYNNKSFQSLPQMAQCMRASCLLPGIAGPIMNRNVVTGELKLGNNIKELDDANWIPMADSLLYEPMPYKSAIKEGATHVVCFRTRPDGTDVTGKSSIFEKLIFHRFFARKNKLPKILSYMRRGLHKMQYGKDVLELNVMAHDGMDRDYTDTSKPHVMTVAVPPGSPEVARLETRRTAILDGVRRGFARAYDCLVEDPKERGRGAIVALEYFPESILDYDPLAMDPSRRDESAFSMYLEQIGEDPEKWKVSAPYNTKENVKQ